MLDTEFIREQTYYPKLCLLQIGTPELVACVDPLALDNLDPLLDLIYDPARLKIFHSASQDLEIFYLLRGRLPAPLFDTQIAAPVLGYDDQIGYAALVESLTGTTLDKSHTRADWSRRPLSQSVIQYAIEDVLYLAQIYPIMRDKLEDLGRTTWLADDFETLADVSRYQDNPDRWLKFPQIDQYQRSELSTIEALSNWRETIAKEKNKPRNWVLDNRTIGKIIQSQPKNSNEMSEAIGNNTLITDSTQALLDIYQQSLTKEPSSQPLALCRPVLNSAQKAQKKKLVTTIEKKSAELDIKSELLTRRKELEKLILGDLSSRLLFGWKKQMLQTELREYIAAEEA